MHALTTEQIYLLRFRDVRSRTERLCAPLAIEDHVPQPMTEVSPPKWHLGHSTWFFETFVLQPYQTGYRPFHPQYTYLFNSYYESFGKRVTRAERGHLSRPTVAEVLAYRVHVDSAIHALLTNPIKTELAGLIELGLQHEQQHQELLVTDIKAILGANPLTPRYEIANGALDLSAEHDGTCASLDDWLDLPAGRVVVGHDGSGFAFDNESPRHAVLVADSQLRQALVTNAEYGAFIADGGYARSALWLAEGWDWVRTQQLHAPLYWKRDESNHWQHYTLSGLQTITNTAPVTHVNFYEADAFCRWAGWRLPTEFEWEASAPHLDWGRRWEWTRSAYLPYPGFRMGGSAVSEYNGKFMVNQQVLRGASFATPPGHSRLTYRNFFHAPTQWQYSGIRPARDVEVARPG